MEMKEPLLEGSLAVCTAESCYLHRESGSAPGKNESQIEDEIFSGWAVRVESVDGNGCAFVTTFYGYRGWVNESVLQPVSAAYLAGRRRMRIVSPTADLLSEPRVQGLPKELLVRGALVELCETDEKGEWSLVRTAAGREGYVHTVFLAPRKDHDGFLLTDSPESYFTHAYYQDFARFPWLTSPLLTDEKTQRENLTAAAECYLHTQYRWGGKSSLGLDCSGLVFMSHLANGLIIHRDASLKPEFPIREIPREELKKGDLIFFPGHVAMYLGENSYIHSTGHYLTPGVTVNSFDSASPIYRKDLDEQVTACGRLAFWQEEVLP